MRYGICAGVLAVTFAVGFTATEPVTLEARQTRASGQQQQGVPSGEVALGTVTIGRDVMADGKPLKAGTYRLRLTGDNATPVPKGQTPEYERWVEFLKGGKVVGREVVSIVPSAEIKDVAQDAPPRPGGSKVQLLKGNEYVRIWVNRGGNHYLIHLPTGTATS